MKRRLLLVLAAIATMVPATPTAGSTTGPAAAVVPPVVARVATFNALGHSHTTATGKSPERLAGPTRTVLAVKIFDFRDLDVIALQEFQTPQRDAFRRIAGDRYGLRCRGDNCVAWRRAEWQLVRASSFRVPYFDGRLRQMPHLVLRSRLDPAVRLSVTSVHNPCDCYRPSHQWRVAGWQREAHLADRVIELRPTVLMGDRNARAAEYLPHRPDGFRPAGRVGIDWILGGPTVRFDNYHRIRTDRIRRATDHPLVYADAELSPLPVIR